MRIINSRDIMETIEMLTAENLDVRTVTMGISLLDCIDPDADKACEKIYNKITRLAGNLVSVVDGISAEYGIPIVNKRISVTPIAMLLGAAPDADPVQYAKTLDRAAKAVGVNFIGGFGALVHKGFSAGDKRLIAAIPRALAETDIVCSSVNIGSTKSGINMDAVKLMGEVVRETAELTKDNMCMGDAKLVVFCNAPEDNPFMAGAFHGAGEPDCEIHVGVSGPGAVRSALAKLPKDAPMDEVAELVKRTAFKITRLGQLVANLASERRGVPAGIIDLSRAPTPAIGDSVANILEEMGLESCGCCGTTEEHIAALKAALKDAEYVRPAPECLDLLPAATEKEAFFLPADATHGAVLTADGDLEDKLSDAMDDEWPMVALKLASWADVDALADYQYMIRKPLCLICDDAELLEAGLRAYQGRALYEGNLTEDALAPLVEKYGLLV